MRAPLLGLAKSLYYRNNWMLCFFPVFDKKYLEVSKRFIKDQNCFETGPNLQISKKRTVKRRRGMKEFLDGKYIGMKSFPHKSDGRSVLSQLLPKINCFDMLDQNYQEGKQCWRKGKDSSTAER